MMLTLNGLIVHLAAGDSMVEGGEGLNKLCGQFPSFSSDYQHVIIYRQNVLI